MMTDWETSNDPIGDIKRAIARGETFKRSARLTMSPAQYEIAKRFEAEILARQRWAKPGTYDGKMNRAQRRAAARTKQKSPR